jgi:tRNA (adenine22-N1)-methyltransferase
LINISNRLKKVAQFVLDDSKSNALIDVGCDHALLDIYLLQNNKDLSIIASDINEGPLSKAKENISKYSLLNKINLCLCDGISLIDDKIDTIVISGMGKDTIVDILVNDKEKLKNVSKLVISSNNKFPELRKEICNLGFVIEDEEIIYEEEKYYIVMKFIKGNINYSDKELYFGPELLHKKDSLFYKYFSYLKNEKEYVLSQLSERCLDKKKKLELEIEKITTELIV